MEVFPTGRRVRVRGVQVHGQTAEAAVAGQRTPLNLAGASTEDFSRGMTLAPPATFEATRRVDVRLRLLPSAPHPLKDRARVHFHSYTMETVVEIVLLERSELDRTPSVSSGHAFAKNAKVAHPSSSSGRPQLLPGQEAFARLKLPEAALLLPGDRFIIRQFAGGDDWRRSCAGCGANAARTRRPRLHEFGDRVPANAGGRRCGSDTESTNRTAAARGNFGLSTRRTRISQDGRFGARQGRTRAHSEASSRDSV